MDFSYIIIHIIIIRCVKTGGRMYIQYILNVSISKLHRNRIFFRNNASPRYIFTILLYICTHVRAILYSVCTTHAQLFSSERVNRYYIKIIR